VGLEMQFLHNRLHFDVDYYNRKTKHAIFDIQIPKNLGTSPNSVIGNNADFQNSGLEFSLGWQNGADNDFHYSLNGNFSYNKNEVLAIRTGDVPLYGAPTQVGGNFMSRTVVGEPIGELFGLQVDGIFQNQAEIDKSAQPDAKPGDFKYKDK